MTDFTELELNKDVADMDEKEAKTTLSEFMDAHEDNQEAYDTLHSELEATEAEFEQKLEEKEERIAQFKQERAEKAAEYVKMPADLLAERFSFDELDTIIEEAAEFSEEEETPEDEEDEETDERLTKFSDRGEKGRRDGGSGTTPGARDRAKELLDQKNFPVSE